MDSRCRWILALAAASMMLLLPTQAVAETQPQNNASTLRSLKTHLDVGPQEESMTSESIKAEPTEESCTATPPDSPERRAGVAETCTAVLPFTAQSSNSVKDARTPTAAAAGSVCTITDPGYWHFERLSYCLREMTVNFTLRGEQQQVLGTAILYVSSSATLNARSGEWREEIMVEATQYTQQVTSLNIAATALCTSTCKATDEHPWNGNWTLTDGQTALGSVTYSDVPAVGVADSATVKYNLYITQPGTIPTLPNVDWSNPRVVRCDSALTGGGNISTGCALPSITPRLELPVSQYGAAAVTYGWAQWNLPNKWGLYSGSPMTRALDGDARRKFTCEEKSSIPFVAKPDDVVLSDSCDEFPFASTEQGGTDGGMCAEIVPLFEDDGKWRVYEADPSRPVTGTEPCVRGHVNLDQNKLAGTAYSNLIQNMRLIEKDPFYLTVPDYFDTVE